VPAIRGSSENCIYPLLSSLRLLTYAHIRGSPISQLARCSLHSDLCVSWLPRPVLLSLPKPSCCVFPCELATSEWLWIDVCPSDLSRFHPEPVDLLPLLQCHRLKIDASDLIIGALLYGSNVWGKSSLDSLQSVIPAM
jgi:hypothetical protein